MLKALASVDDLAKGIDGGIDSEDEDRAEWILQVVSGWARGIARRDWLTTDPPNDVVAVVLLASRRLFQSGEHGFLVQWNEGPLGEKYSEKNVPEGVFLPAELAILERVWRKRGLWTKSFYRDDVSTSIGYLNTVPAGKLMPVFQKNEPFFDESIHD
jgi:hypothetical protein